MIDAASEAQLEELIRRLQSATGDVMVVATVKTFQPFADLPSYAVEMFENGGQGIGVKGKDNGAADRARDRRSPGARSRPATASKASSPTGSPAKPAASMVPFFREAEYGRGLVAGATRVAQRIAEGRNVDLTLAPPPQARSSRRRGSGGFPIGFWVVMLIIFLNMMRGGRRRRRRRLGERRGSVRRRLRRRRSAAAAGRAAADSAAGLAGSAAAGPAAAAVERLVVHCECVVITDADRKGAMNSLKRLLVVVVLTGAAVASSGCSYNRFVSQEESIKTQLAQVDNQLQRRNDLIPNLVEATKGFAQQERDVFQAIADSRVEARRRHHARAADCRRPTNRARRWRGCWSWSRTTRC